MNAQDDTLRAVTAALANDDDLVKLVDRDQLTKVISNWNYAGRTNNHSAFSQYTAHLKSLSDKFPGLEARDKILAFYNDLMSPNNMKMVYRCLSQKKATTIAVLKVLNNLLDYDKSLVSSLINNFDLESPSLLNLLPKNDSIRTVFISFWLNLNRKMSYFDRKLHLNSKIWFNIFKIIESDPDDSIKSVLTFIDDCVLNESNFRKPTKIKLVNETLVFNLQKLINKKNLEIMAFFRKLIDGKSGILFYDYDMSTVVKVGDKTYKVYNKILYNLLTFIKIDSVVKVNLVSLILSSDVSLIEPYMNWIIINGGGFHEADLTNWYINHSLLYIRVLEFSPVTAETIMLKPLSKSCLARGLAHKSPLIVELNLQLILSMLVKLDKTDDSKVAKYCLKNLPEVSTLLSIKSDSQVIQLLLLKTIKYYSKYSTNLNATLVKFLNTELDLVISNTTKINLLKLGYITSIKVNLNEKFEIKWFNKLNNSHSLFTNLVKLANKSDSDKSDKKSNVANNLNYFYKLINDLVDTDTFSTNTPLNPLWSVLYYSAPEQVYQLLDEVIQKAVSNPYKYYDMSGSLNVFIIVLIEQFSYHLKKIESAQKEQSLEWFSKVLRNSKVIGQSETEMLKLLKQFEINVDTNLFNLDKAFKPSDTSIGEVVINTPAKNLNANLLKNKFVMNIYDLCCLIHKINILAQDKSDKSALILEMFEKISSYISSGNSEIVDNPFFYEKFLFPVNVAPTDNIKVLTASYNDFLRHVPEQPVNFQKAVLEIFKADLSDEQAEMYSAYNWIIDDKDLQKEYPSEVLNLSNFNVLISKSITPNISLEKLFDYKPDQKLSVLKFMLQSKKLIDYIDIILEKRYYSLLSEIDDEVVEHLLTKNMSEEVLALIGSLIVCDQKSVSIFAKVNLDSAKKQLSQTNYLKLMYNVLVSGNASQSDIESFMNSTKIDSTFTTEVVNILSLSNNSEMVGNWMNKSMVFITKQFAEQPELSEDFISFIDHYHKLFKRIKLVSSNIIDTQLEVIVRSSWVTSVPSLKYLNRLITSLKKLNGNKFSEIFITNEKNVLNSLPAPDTAEVRIESALLLFNLFQKDPSANILTKVLSCYNGSTRFEDLILKKLLVQIEEIQSTSWISRVESWELNKLNANDMELVGQQRLLIPDKNRFAVSLNLNFIENMLLNNVYLELPNTYEGIVEFVSNNLFEVSYQYENTVYDHEFLLLLLLNNDEFFKFEESKVLINFKNLINYHILEIMVKNYKHSAISQNIVKNLLRFIDEDQSFKDKNLFKIYLSNLLNTPSVFDIQLKIYSSLVPILANPTHFMYEVVYKYVLSNPTIRGLPLFNKVKQSEKRVIDSYIKNFLTVSSTDLQLLNSNNFIEWMLNLLNLSSLPATLESTILKVLFNLCDIENGGLTLVTRYSIISFLEQLKNRQNPNIQQISAKLTLLGSKRVLEWTGGDVKEHAKRMKTN